ncbi:MAG: sigma-54-dependent Fis family transcriptional regulator [Polyangiaceae bacterium UTPRO1]|jgi:DNA-binding NtrC family response regulator|nr:sigma-54 dependent transcriptional regulator [Myxococcales bacterium]OQY67133.1 MAG: sigma-54-dependent Fis family transcriptional regulator [Polyangiaceae bacterium UTPRO1]
MPSALIVDDDPDLQAAMAELVLREGFAVETAGSLAAARAVLAIRAPDVVLVDLTLPDGNGLELLSASEGPEAPEMVVISGHATLANAIEALRQGASDYLTKPIDLPRLRAILGNVARRCDLAEEIEGLRAELRGLGRFGALIGGSPVMQQVYEQIQRVAPSNATVLIQGESGTGKELVAESVHRLSRRRKRPFVVINCGAVAPNLIESELFGHERGSFTGAERLHRGYIERAAGGTLFLDEITEMPLELQAKLLRVLETGRFSRVGGEEDLPVDVRFIAATNRDPQQAVGDQKLRADLLYRLRVFPIVLPPLRERTGDIDLLAEACLAELNKEEGTRKRLSGAALERLRSYHWPGNVRELRNAVHRAFILADDEIGPRQLSDSTPLGPPPESAASGGEVMQVEIGSSIADVERRLILATLAACAGNKDRAAKILGISLKTLYNRLNSYKGVSAPAV